MHRHNKKLDNKIYILLSYAVIYAYYYFMHGTGGIYEIYITSRNFRVLFYISIIHIVILLYLLIKKCIKKYKRNDNTYE